MSKEYNSKALFLITKHIFTREEEYLKEDFEVYLNSYLQKCESPIEEIMFGILLNLNLDIPCDIPEHNFPLTLNAGIYPQSPFENYRVDFLIEVGIEALHNTKGLTFGQYVIECDGHDFHEKTKEQAKRDKKRDRLFTSKGYKVLRFTGSEIYSATEEVLEEIQGIITSDIRKFKKENIKQYAEILIENGEL